MRACAFAHAPISPAQVWYVRTRTQRTGGGEGEGGIPHERRRYKVVQVHRVNGSSELIHAGWRAAFRYARRGAARGKRAGTWKPH
jgi:hypothetical protein